MKPTKDNIVVGFESVDFISTSDDETKKQILDDHEKARKYPKLIEENQNLKYERIDLMNKLRQNQKLRELIEKRIEELRVIIDKEEKNLKDVTIGFKEMSYRMIEKDIEKRLELQKLLEECKK